MSTLDLGLVGNGAVSALVDPSGEITWACMPRPDADPVFCSLLRPRAVEADFGYLSIELEGRVSSEQRYVPNTPLLVTRLVDAHGAALEVLDFAPRFRQHGRLFAPAQLVRQVRPVAGSPRIRVRLRPAADYGAARPTTTWGSNHIRYAGSGHVLRVTTDASITYLLEERAFVLREPFALLMGPDETLQGGVAEVARHFRESTEDYWRDWVRGLSIPFEWQEAVIRAAITLKLAAFDDTGAVIAAPTTSIPEAPDSGRNWDYRYCWLRDAHFVVDALNRLNATRTMERYLGYVINLAAQAGDRLQPVYGICGRAGLDEAIAPALPGYRGMGPVRVGNLAFQQAQHDIYGAAVLAATHAFFDQRLAAVGNEGLFRVLERLGEHAVALHAEPDAGPWELRESAHPHTYSAVMCWAACDRLSRIGQRLGLSVAAARWKDEAARIHAVVSGRCWSERRRSFVATFDGDTLDASLLLLAELGFLRADDPRYVATVDAVGRELRRGDFVFRYAHADDFGAPQTAFLVCTFWYVDALAAIGRREEARALFESLLACRNPLGMLSEDADPATNELWGNFPQTYSMVGLINSAARLSLRWDEAWRAPVSALKPPVP